jgi:catechol 2,3-dioxygenase-like lactoylglutathione lyase family enzyme
MIKFSYTILYVQDVTKTIEFYEKAFGLKRKFIAPNNEYGELSTGDTTLSFASVELAKSNFKHGFTQSSRKGTPFAFEIAFTTENVDETYNAAIKAGATAEAPAEWKPQGQTVAYVRDPDGFIIEICTAMN